MNVVLYDKITEGVRFTGVAGARIYNLFHGYYTYIQFLLNVISHQARPACLAADYLFDLSCQCAPNEQSKCPVCLLGTHWQPLPNPDLQFGKPGVLAGLLLIVWKYVVFTVATLQLGDTKYLCDMLSMLDKVIEIYLITFIVLSN